MQFYAKPGHYRTQRILALAEAAELPVAIADNAGDGGAASGPSDMFGKIPVLDTGKGCIFSSNAIGRYLARIRPDVGLYGQNFLEGGEVDSWVEYSTHELEVPMGVWTFPLDKIFPDVTQATTRAKLDVAECLNVLDGHLKLRTFMVGDSLTFADVHIASVLYHPSERHGVLTQLLNDRPHLKRWYELIKAQPTFRKVFGGGAAAPAAKAAAKGENKGEKKQENKGAKGEKKQAPKKEEKKEFKPPARDDVLKRVVKEGGKRGVEIEGAADMGGLRYFCTSVEKPEGDVDLLLESMKAMNAKSDPSEEERKGGAGHIGKILSHNYPVSWTT